MFLWILFPWLLFPWLFPWLLFLYCYFLGRHSLAVISAGCPRHPGKAATLGKCHYPQTGFLVLLPPAHPKSCSSGPTSRRRMLRAATWSGYPKTHPGGTGSPCRAGCSSGCSEPQTRSLPGCVGHAAAGGTSPCGGSHEELLGALRGPCTPQDCVKLSFVQQRGRASEITIKTCGFFNQSVL